MSNGTSDEFYSFGFEGVVDTLDYEKYLYSVIYLPAEIAAQLPLLFTRGCASRAKSTIIRFPARSFRRRRAIT